MTRAVIALFAVLVLGTLACLATLVVLVLQLEEQRAVQAERAEARTELVRQDVAEILDELRDPVGDTRREELFRRAVRIEELLEDLHDLMTEDQEQ